MKTGAGRSDKPALNFTRVAVVWGFGNERFGCSGLYRSLRGQVSSGRSTVMGYGDACILTRIYDEFVNQLDDPSHTLAAMKTQLLMVKRAQLTAKDHRPGYRFYLNVTQRRHMTTHQIVDDATFQIRIFSVTHEFSFRMHHVPRFGIPHSLLQCNSQAKAVGKRSPGLVSWLQVLIRQSVT